MSLGEEVMRDEADSIAQLYVSVFSISNLHVLGVHGVASAVLLPKIDQLAQRHHKLG